MKEFKLTLFLFTVWCSIISATMDNNSALEPHAIYQKTIIKDNDLNADKHIINMTSDTINYSNEFFYTEDVQKICHAQVNEFVWKCPTIGDSEKKILKISYDRWHFLNFYLVFKKHK